ncbi:hypothetical protein [Azospirillum agricola]|uniref:hypothetical protein n=1 Tax=Azospirillum agricola TaxID=1720247 RepID=UPI000A0F08C8|nr:hypothetical protein [Azospirillum agricola]SMH52740.1 hypothetical protein SAMN02982994_3213 [Azospirillum lipoferum]
MTDPTVRCERCHKTYPAEESGCPNCLSIRRTNAVIGTTLVLLAILALGGWVGAMALL